MIRGELSPMRTDGVETTLFDDEALPLERAMTHKKVSPSRPAPGILPRQHIVQLLENKQITSLGPIEDGQLQPASLDLRLGRYAYRVRASFLPGKRRTVKAQLPDLALHRIKLEDGAVLEKNCVYLVELQEHINLPQDIAATANPKSSTGRLDVFVRLITDKTDVFDYVEAGYRGPLYAEVSPRSFAIKVRQGSRLNQLRFRRISKKQRQYRDFGLSDAKLESLHNVYPLVIGSTKRIRRGLHVSVDLKSPGHEGIAGYRARRNTAIIDIEQVGQYRVEDFWEPVRAEATGRLILDPLEFYILVSCERLSVPPGVAAEMVPIDPLMGEFRVHYAGFFDPGFGYSSDGSRGSRAVLEVRSHEVPFFLEHGQTVGRLIYEELVDIPTQLYGRGIGSNYQGQGLKLSKHFLQACEPGLSTAITVGGHAPTERPRRTLAKKKRPRTRSSQLKKRA